MMTSLTEQNLCVSEPEYDKNFWNAMRGQIVVLDKLTKGRHTSTDSYRLPKYADDKFTMALEQESLFRQIASGIKAYGSVCRIFAVDSNDMASFVSEYAQIPIYDGKDDFRKIPVDSWKLAIFVKFEEDLVHDANFSFEKYLLTQTSQLKIARKALCGKG